MSAETLTAAMKAAAGDAWDRAVNHRLFREIAADTVSGTVFHRYLCVEYGFVDQAAVVLGHAVAKAPSFIERCRLAAGLHGLTTEQQDYFTGAFRALGVAPEMRRGGRAAALHEVFGTTARDGSFAEIAACMLGAEWLYHTWCSAAVRTPSRRAFVADWVALHAGGGFADHVAWLRGWLDAYGETVDAAAAARLAGLFKRVLEAEIVFHDAAYDTGGEQERS